MIRKAVLEDLYIRKGKSMQEIADELGCSPRKISYWMDKHAIARRSISDAVYLRSNPDGDPFKFKRPDTLKDAKLMGLGLGLYWGEGGKANKHSVRLGNTDPALIKNFIDFLVKIYSVDKERLTFGLQIFSDIDPRKALQYWVKELNVKRNQFQKTIVVTPSRGKGSYRKKIQHGVLTVHLHNRKLRDSIVEKIKELGYLPE